MKDEYYKVYKDLYESYVQDTDLVRRERIFTPDDYYYVRIIRRSINKADNKYILRSDAKYFLIVNFHHLIVRPLIKRRPKQDLFNQKGIHDLEDSIQSDINLIVSGAIRERREQEISGHQIMRSIDKLWKKLETTKLEIWG